MKQVEFPPGTFSTTKTRVAAILWAAYRKGNRTFESSTGNVLQELTQYLNDHGAGYTKVEVSGAMKYLIDKGYATKATNGRKTYSFTIADDVNLEVGPPKFVLDKLGVTSNGHAPLPTEDIPLPGEPERVEPYRLTELSSLLGEWHDINPEAYAAWVDKVIPRLEKETRVGLA